MEPQLGRQNDTKNGAGSARCDKADTANASLHKQASTHPPEVKPTNPSSGATRPTGTNQDHITPGFLRAFADALDIAAIADSVLQRASEARYRSLVVDSLAREAHEHSTAVTDIAYDVCRAAVAASSIALETTKSTASMEDAYASYVDVKQPPINLEQFQGVVHFAQSHRNSVRHQMPLQTNSKYPQTSKKPPLSSQSRGRKATRETRSAPTRHASSRSRSRSPEAFHEKFPSTVVQCMEEFVQKCSSCSSLPSLPEDEEVDEESSLEEEESGPDVTSSYSSVESPRESPREDKSSKYQDLCDKLLHHHSPPLPQLRKVSDCELVEETTRTKMSRVLETSSRSRSPTAGSDRGKPHSRPCSPLAVRTFDSGSKNDIQVLGNNTQLFQPQGSRLPTGVSASSTAKQITPPSDGHH